MLKGIDPLLGPDLLHALAAMGHGDEIGIVDANFPVAATARRLIRVDGAGAPAVLAAVLSLLPLDTFTGTPASVMAVVGDPGAVPPPVCEFQAIVDGVSGTHVRLATLERNEFYERARRAFAVVVTGERRFYGNILVTKGVVPP
ncbi:MAG TPA: RbsD/FucU domain-containing protein [Stellaceae bacterium]|nr:RbsD/FucU domain-containing protein [Stellaceae bacterium]